MAEDIPNQIGIVGSDPEKPNAPLSLQRNELSSQGPAVAAATPARKTRHRLGAP